MRSLSDDSSISAILAISDDSANSETSLPDVNDSYKQGKKKPQYIDWKSFWMLYEQRIIIRNKRFQIVPSSFQIHNALPDR